MTSLSFQTSVSSSLNQVWESLPHRCVVKMYLDFPSGASGTGPACQCRRHKRCRFNPWVRKIPWRRAWQPTPVFLPEESRGRRNLVGYSSWDLKEWDTAEQLTLSFFLFFSVKVIYSPCLATTTTHLQRNSFHLAQLKLCPH